MKQLITHIKQSIYGPTYYQELLAKPFSFSIKYYLALALLLALFGTIIAAIPLVPLTEKVLSDAPEKFFAYYPDELEITIDKGGASSNVPEPYFLPLPAILKGDDTPLNKIDSLLVIDTKTPFSVEQFTAYKSLAWLGLHQLAMYDQGGSVRVTTIDEGARVVVNEVALRGLESKLQPFYKFISPLLVLAILAGLLIAFLAHLIYLILGALLILLLGRIMKQGWSYGTSYRIGLHAITLPLLLDGVLTLLGFPLGNLPFLFSGVMVFVVYLNFQHITQVATPPVSTPLTPAEKPEI